MQTSDQKLPFQNKF